MKKYIPVTLPPGRLRLATPPPGHRRSQRRSESLRSLASLRTLHRCCLQAGRPPDGAPNRPPAVAGDRIGRPPSGIQQPRSGLRHSRLASGRRGMLRPAGATVRLPRRRGTDHRHCRLLRACRERPRRRAAEQRDEVAPLHSITSSARATRVRGTSRPSTFAVRRLRNSSTFVVCWTGRSAGLSPLRIRPV